MKSILKTSKKLEDGSATQSSSIGVLRWKLPEESVQAHSSAPSRSQRPNENPEQQQQQQQHPRQNSLKDLRSLQECVLFIQHWKEQVDQVCKGGPKAEEGGGAGKRSHAEQSVEECRRLILDWAQELTHLDRLLKEPTWACEEERGEDTGEDEAQMRMMAWAKELQETTQSCGVSSEELGQVLRLLGLKKKRILVKVQPLLEFITWSLLKEDKARMIPQLWLLEKQRTWEAGIPRYIPNSVWSWISSSAANVLLDPSTNHPWLQVSDDQRMVQEGLSPSELPDGPQRFDAWPCVLAWEGYGAGRHYWEVDIANKGYWRVGVTAAGAQRRGRFPMNPRRGYWALWRSTHDFFACTKPETRLPVGLAPRRMGVYLDYEEGQVSFYNAETKSHIYTFAGSFGDKVYPLFAPLDGRTLMRIIPPR